MPVAYLLVCALATSASATKPARSKSVLVMPVDARPGVSPSTAETFTQLIAQEIARLPKTKVVTMREVEAVMTQEKYRQLVDCSAVSCALEIAGSLDTDEVVIGSMSVIGKRRVVTMSRVNGRNGTSLGRASVRLNRADEDAVVEAVHDVARQLYPDLPPAPSPVAVEETPARKEPEPTRATRNATLEEAPRRQRKPFVPGLAVAGGVIGIGAFTGIVAIMLFAGFGGIWFADWASRGFTDSRVHNIPFTVAMMGAVMGVTGVFLTLLSLLGVFAGSGVAAGSVAMGLL